MKPNDPTYYQRQLRQLTGPRRLTDDPLVAFLAAIGKALAPIMIIGTAMLAGTIHGAMKPAKPSRNRHH